MGTLMGLSGAVETLARIVAAPLGGHMLESSGAGTLSVVAACTLLPCLLVVVMARGKEGEKRLAPPQESSEVRETKKIR
jgi:predicted MFS family arabinose efflux permease